MTISESLTSTPSTRQSISAHLWPLAERAISAHRRQSLRRVFGDDAIGASFDDLADRIDMPPETRRLFFALFPLLESPAPGDRYRFGDKLDLDLGGRPNARLNDVYHLLTPLPADRLTDLHESFRSAITLADRAAPEWWAFTTTVVRRWHLVRSPGAEVGGFSVDGFLGHPTIITPHSCVAPALPLVEQLVHEATHQLLYLISSVSADFRFAADRTGVLLPSPWTGALLPTASFGHACIVWAVLRELHTDLATAAGEADVRDRARARTAEIDAGFHELRRVDVDALDDTVPEHLLQRLIRPAAAGDPVELRELLSDLDLAVATP